MIFYVVLPHGQAQDRKLWIIAHRGGVIDSLHAENSLEGLEEAIRRGYTHVEVDARITSDGYVVCYHNANLRKETSAKGLISKMPLKEVQKASLSPYRSSIPTFEEYCQRCAGRIGLMIDIKGCKKSQIISYCQQIEQALNQYDLYNDALILINQFTLNNQVPIAKLFWAKSKSLGARNYP